MSTADETRVRTVFIGTGSFGVRSLRALAEAPEVRLVGVVTTPARPAGRGGALRTSPVAETAAALGIGPVLAPGHLRRPEAVADVLALSPSLIVLADYGQIVPRALLEVSLGALNLHPSLLPRHRGAVPVPATILAGDTSTGVVLMRMDAGLDTGPLVAVEEMFLRGDETGPDLEAALAEHAAALLQRSLPDWISGMLRARPQSGAGATLTRPLHREDGRLDPAREPAALERQVRAFQPWPGSWFESDGGRFTVWRAAVSPLPAPADAEPGQLLTGDRGLGLTTSDGVLELLEVQPAGGRRMSGAEVLRGRPGLVGARVDAPRPAVDRGPIERPVGYSGRP